MNQDKSNNPALSPVAFTRAFQQYRAAAGRTHFADSRLLLAARFWMGQIQALESAQFATYWRQDLPPLLSEMHAGVLGDLTAEETEELAVFVERAGQVFSDDNLVPEMLLQSVWESAARKWFYLGQVGRACDALMNAGICATPCTEEVGSILEQAGSLEAHDIPAFLIDEVRANYPALSEWLTSFATSWRVEREAGAVDSAHCLLVEYDPNGKPVRGRMRRLAGKIEKRRNTADTDEIIFHNQLKAPDDPFVGAIYGALDSLRSTISRGNKKSAHCFYRGRFEISGSNSEAYGGNSIGLAAFATTYGSWWNAEIHRERKLINYGVAITGGVDSGESVQPVAEDTLKYKIDRAFRSPLSYVVVPEANRKTVEQIVKTLRGHYPRRRLHIIGVERPDDIIADNNIFRPEKVCPTTFVYQKARHYTRSVKVQVPILLALVYLMMSIIYPKAWVGFDRNPQYVRVIETGFEALNADSSVVWSTDLGCVLKPAESFWKVGDLDDDGRNEVAFMPKAVETSTCKSNARLYVYGDNGKLRFDRPGIIYGEYPGDFNLQQPYSPFVIDFLDIAEEPVILTRVYRSSPARIHLRFWSATGDSLGWYINAGHNGTYGDWFSSTSQFGLSFLSYNNRMDCACLFILAHDSSYGASPPYTDPELDLSHLKHANQIRYVLFPRTNMNKAAIARYNPPMRILVESDSVLRADIWQLVPIRSEISYYFNRELRVFEVGLSDDFINQRKILIADGKLPRSEAMTTEQIRNAVTYWIDDAWVTEGELRAREENCD